MLNAGDTAFLMMCTAMVCLMTPALAFFYGVLVRKTDILTIMFQTFVCLGLVTFIWVLGGFSLVFGPDIGQIIGNPLTFFGMHGIGGEANARHAATVPFIVFFAYRMMFAIIIAEPTSPEGEGFQPSPKGTLIGKHAVMSL